MASIPRRSCTRSSGASRPDRRRWAAGFAIPHARVRAIEQPLTLFMRLKRAIAFGAPDGRPVSQLLVILVPTEGSRQDDLDLLAAVARLFSDADFRSELEKSPDVAAAVAAFRAGIARIFAR